MTTTRRNMLRVTAIPLLALTVLFGVPSHSAVRATAATVGGNIRSAAVALPLRRVSNGKIAFVRGMFIAVINPDGSGYQQLTPACSCTTGALAWSPDGRRLAFLQAPLFSQTLSLFVVNANGTGERRLTRCGDCGYGVPAPSLSWSPDGSRIVFSHYGSLYTVDVESGRLRQLTTCGTKNSCGDVTPIWSPHTQRIVFTRVTPHSMGADVYLVNADGTGLKRLTGYVGDVGAPLWSPDGQRIAIDGGDGIYTVNADGSHARLVLSEQQGPALLSWSPVGTRLLFGSHPGYGNAATSHAEVWEMKVDGTGRRRLYRSACCVGRFSGPIWSPDGRYIAFGHGYLHPAPTVLYVMDKDGHHVHRVIQIGGGGSINGGSQMVWQPIP